MNKENQINILREKVKELENKRLELLLKRKDYSKEEFSKLIPEINKLLTEIIKLKDEIELLKGPILSNSVIDIYFEEESSDKETSFYYLTISGEKQKIGRININWELYDYMLGNIGAELDKEYRGNRYTLQALDLLKDLMIDKGLTKPIITARPDNIPSIKTIQNFGGKLIDQESELNIYEVDLLENNVPRKH